MDLCNPKEIKALLGRHGFRFSKQMGQNFLIQEWVPRQTAEASGAAPGVGVLEIGPGIGPLTAQLARRGEKVVSVELDRTLLPILAETLSDYDNVEIVPGDILKTDIPGIWVLISVCSITVFRLLSIYTRQRLLISCCPVLCLLLWVVVTQLRSRCIKISVQP